jgi:hypothetical protein
MNESEQKMKAALALFEAAHGRRSRALADLNGMKPVPHGSDPTPSSPAAWDEFKHAVAAEDDAYAAYVRARDAWVATLK